MKTKRFTCSITAAIILAAFPATGCAEKEKEKTAETPLPPPKVATTETTKVAPAPAPAPAPVPETPDVISARWSSIKDLTYDQRAQFFAGAKQLEARVEAQVGELTARREAMPSTANTKDWDFAMTEMRNARAYLRSMSEEMLKATPESWAQQKDKVGAAWLRTQDAFAKVKASTTT